MRESSTSHRRERFGYCRLERIVHKQRGASRLFLLQAQLSRRILTRRWDRPSGSVAFGSNAKKTYFPRETRRQQGFFPRASP